MNKTPESRHRIRFKDCDPMGHLYNTRFIEYMLEAREDQLIEHYGLSLMDYADQRKMAWVLIRHEINYLKEAKRNETVIIKTQIIHTDDKSLIMEYQMWNEDRSHLKTILWSRFLHIDLMTKRTAPHPKDVQEMLESLVIPITEVSIDERVKSLLRK